MRGSRLNRRFGRRSWSLGRGNRRQSRRERTTSPQGLKTVGPASVMSELKAPTPRKLRLPLRTSLGGVCFGEGRGELETDEPVGGDGVALHFGRGEVPAVGGLQRLVGKIFAGAGGKKRGGSNVARGIDMELDGYTDSAADGGAGLGRNAGHDLIEHFALGNGASGRLRGRLDTRRIGDAGEGGGSRRGIRRTQRALVIRFLRRRLRRSQRCALRRRRR